MAIESKLEEVVTKFLNDDDKQLSKEEEVVVLPKLAEIEKDLNKEFERIVRDFRDDLGASVLGENIKNRRFKILKKALENLVESYSD